MLEFLSIWWMPLLAVFVFFALFIATIYLRWKMITSKAYFAVFVVGTMLSVFILSIGALATSIPSILFLWIVDVAITIFALDHTIDPEILLSATPLSFFPQLTLSAIAISSIIYINRFASNAFQQWNGPVTLTVNELAKDHLDNNLAMLALYQLRNVFTGRSDQLISDVAVNWEQRISAPPDAPSWPNLSRSLFLSGLREADIPDNAWRDRTLSWIGTIYVGVETQPVPLVVLVFNTRPNAADISARLDALSPTTSTVVYAVYQGVDTFSEQMLVAGRTVTVWSEHYLLTKGLTWEVYARDLVKQFDRTVVGGTSVPLSRTYIEPRVSRPGGEKQLLRDVVAEWLKDGTRRHLAITGEYGQGKSTAMLAMCAEWARAWLSDRSIDERIPLLVELRGKNPAETDPSAFLSTWAARYNLYPQQIMNLIRAGKAILIFEGFDELRNAGRAFERHEQFNALWQFAFPETKIIFTGRPNFFLDKAETNRTLRLGDLRGAGGGAFTELWELDRLKQEEIRLACEPFGPEIADAIDTAARDHSGFFEIVSRPSMIPVVVTIWPSIERMRSEGHDLTGALLIESYLRAIYQRKIDELEADRRERGAPKLANYILLPTEFREILTLSVASYMASASLKNTITRPQLHRVVVDAVDGLLLTFKKDGVPAHVVEQIVEFEERFKTERKAERIERIVTEVATAGLLVADPVGGENNLRFPHKQFFEYYLARAIWIAQSRKNSEAAIVINDKFVSSGVFSVDLTEPGCCVYLSEIYADRMMNVTRNQPLVSIMIFLNAAWERVRFKFYFVRNRDHIHQREAHDDKSHMYSRENINTALAEYISTALMPTMFATIFFYIFIIRGLDFDAGFRLVVFAGIFLLFVAFFVGLTIVRATVPVMLILANMVHQSYLRKGLAFPILSAPEVAWSICARELFRAPSSTVEQQAKRLRDLLEPTV